MLTVDSFANDRPTASRRFRSLPPVGEGISQKMRKSIRKSGWAAPGSGPLFGFEPRDTFGLEEFRQFIEGWEASERFGTRLAPRRVRLGDPANRWTEKDIENAPWDPVGQGLVYGGLGAGDVVAPREVEYTRSLDEAINWAPDARLMYQVAQKFVDEIWIATGIDGRGQLSFKFEGKEYEVPYDVGAEVGTMFFTGYGGEGGKALVMSATLTLGSGRSGVRRAEQSVRAGAMPSAGLNVGVVDGVPTRDDVRRV